MATKLAGKTAKKATKAPSDQLKDAAGQLMSTLAQRTASSVGDRLSATTRRLTDYSESGGKAGGLTTAVTGASKLAEGKSPVSAMLSTGFSRLKDKVKGAFGGGGGGGAKPKITNIVESVDIGVPVDLAYAQWTRFAEFPRYMKKVENVDQTSQEKLVWKAKIFWSHRTWEATIQEQVPNERIIWTSTGEKGHVDGAVTFHELAPNLTRVVLVLEYHPQGLFEKTGNIWRAQGRRARLELKHFQRHATTDSLLHPDEIEGWQGEIRDGEVVDDGSGQDDDQDRETDENTDENAGVDENADTDEDAPEPEEEDEEPAERPRRGTTTATKSRGSSTRARKTRAGGRT